MGGRIRSKPLGANSFVGYVMLSSDDDSVPSPSIAVAEGLVGELSDAPEAAGGEGGNSVFLGKRVRVERKMDEVHIFDAITHRIPHAKTYRISLHHHPEMLLIPEANRKERLLLRSQRSRKSTPPA